MAGTNSLQLRDGCHKCPLAEALMHTCKTVTGILKAGILESILAKFGILQNIPWGLVTLMPALQKRGAKNKE